MKVKLLRALVVDGLAEPVKHRWKAVITEKLIAPACTPQRSRLGSRAHDLTVSRILVDAFRVDSVQPRRQRGEF